MGLIPNRKQWRKWTVSSKWSYLSSFISLFGVMLATLSIFFQSTTSTEIEEKVNNLTKIREALSSLDTYVETQQKALKRLSSEKFELEKEREKIQKILDIDKDKINALFDYQATQERKRTWLEIIVSFFIGVLSSSVVTFLAIKWQNKKELHNNANAADAKSRTAD